MGEGCNINVIYGLWILSYIMKKNDLEKSIANSFPPPFHKDVFITQEQRNYLSRDNPHLLLLKGEYLAFNKNQINESQWNDAFCEAQINFPYFRGDNAYIWQLRNNNLKSNYDLSAKYILSNDRLGLLNKTKEDGAFGVFTYFTEAGILASRDLLDSITELYFLENILGISKKGKIKIIDIGAGYGRLAHRAIECFDNIETFYCTDAIAESTFLSKFYLNYRCASGRSEVIPLHEAKATIKSINPDIAVNIHSFSECSVHSIDFWISCLAEGKVKYLMIVPNNHKSEGGKNLLSLEADSSLIRYERILNDYGYQLMVKMPKYLDAEVQRYGVSPTYYHLYELI